MAITYYKNVANFGISIRSIDDAFYFSNDAGKELDLVVHIWEFAIFHRWCAEYSEGVQDAANGWWKVGEASGRGTSKAG